VLSNVTLTTAGAVPRAESMSAVQEGSSTSVCSVAVLSWTWLSATSPARTWVVPGRGIRQSSPGSKRANPTPAVGTGGSCCFPARFRFGFGLSATATAAGCGSGCGCGFACNGS
jgi:hypothetical protein